MTPRDFNVALIGYGFAGKILHAPLIQAVPQLKLHLIAISGVVEGTASTSDYMVATQHPETDLVVIASPNNSHYPLALSALQAGKHVVVDKPFTLNSQEAQHLIALAREKKLLLSVFHNRRWDADFLTVQQVLGSGLLGELRHFEASFNRFRPTVLPRWRESEQQGGGLWYDLAPHLLDQAVQLFGMPVGLYVDMAVQRDNAKAIDWFHALLHYPEHKVILHASALTAYLAPRFVLHGTAGSYSKFGLDTQEDFLRAGKKPLCEAWGIDPSVGEITTASGTTPYANAVGNYVQYYHHIAKALAGEGENPVPADEALQVMKLIDLGQASFEQKRYLGVV